MSVVVDIKMRRLLLAAVILGLVSLAPPWWNLVVFRQGQLLSYFGSCLWGVVKTGFLKSDFSYEWWSYTTFALIGAACAGGLLGYKAMKTNPKTARMIVLLEMVFTVAACVFYTIFLSSAFPKTPATWMIEGGNPPFMASLANLQLFHFNYHSELDVFIGEFLSAGFFLALASFLISLIVFIKLLGLYSSISPTGAAAPSLLHRIRYYRFKESARANAVRNFMRHCVTSIS
jgi:hypothetical protein